MSVCVCVFVCVKMKMRGGGAHERCSNLSAVLIFFFKFGVSHCLSLLVRVFHHRIPTSSRKREAPATLVYPNDAHGASRRLHFSAPRERTWQSRMESIDKRWSEIHLQMMMLSAQGFQIRRGQVLVFGLAYLIIDIPT